MSAIKPVEWSVSTGLVPYPDAVRTMEERVPAIALGYAVARLGCFLNGDDFGIVTTVPWGVQFPPGTEAFANHLANGWVSVGDTLSLPVHPTQLYHAAAGLLLFVVLRSWKPAWPGQRLALALTGYGLLRFGIEFLRGDAAPVVGTLHAAHLFGALFVVSGAFLWWWHTRHSSPAPAMRPGPLTVSTSSE